ncbi:putative sulfate exporter family transporter [Acidaminobacter sp. JC074]|uniref:YeiH family protein n=1 Tax=Acidaminobacter sp. JC074 TaxID=2530199 RepID=UPI001F0E55D5|nr:putative sulfate exporter family transporter [Acidaminobacter sp. JC074]MCH4885924.1 putative sulfate exporter family transporter [Acidaminobacter sp. JC074]
MKVKKLLPGILFVVLIAIVSMWLQGLIKPYFALETLTIAIIIGMIYNNTVGTQIVLAEGIKFSLKKLLKVGIVLLGFKLNMTAVLDLGPNILLLVAIFVPATLFTFMYVSKKFGLNKKLGTLLGVGSCICGASAVVALAPVIGADDDDAVVAVSIVSVLGAIGVIAYTAISKAPMSDATYGIWSGLTLHGVAHALAAAFARGDVAGEIGTFVKMTRVLMLVPVSLFLSYHFNGSSESKRAKFPMYVLYFIIAGIINSLGILPEALTGFLAKSSSFLILMAMTAMGLSVNFKQVAKKGAKAFVIGLVLFVVLSTFGFAAITMMV